VLASGARFRVLACGRRWGKSLLALMACLLEARRRGAVIWYVAPTFRMADLHWRTLRRNLPPGYPAALRQSERRLVCANGAEVAFRSADNPDHLRGVGLDFLVVDEAAFLLDGAATWAEALRPTLSDRRGRALIISTPRGRDWFHALWLRGQQQADPEVASFWFPTASNPAIAGAELEAARREVPQRVFEQEYEARFLDDGGAVFRRVRAAAVASTTEPYPGRFVVGVDWGKRDDFTVFVVLDAERGVVTAIERFNHIDYTLQTQRLKALCERWRPQVVQVEQNAMGDPLLEQLQRDGLPAVGFKTTAASKPKVIDALALAFEQEALTVPPDPALLAELEAYTMEPTRAGNFRYSAPAGLHDDCVMALALAWHARGAGAVGALAAFV
jgi:phage terminase large subunit-like protein